MTDAERKVAGTKAHQSACRRTAHRAEFNALYDEECFIRGLGPSRAATLYDRIAAAQANLDRLEGMR